MKSLNDLDHFKYRLVNGKVIKNDGLNGSYTVLNQDNLFNYTCFQFKNDRDDFIQESLAAKAISSSSRELLNTAIEETKNDSKDYVYITSLPWFDFTSIQHPVYQFKSADVPSIAWGKFHQIDNQKIRMPFSIQVHHGFVDGIHIHQLALKISEVIHSEIS
jgi:chloramphenicol O-acetyltransferase type A